jgi:hypothetical protein
VTQGETGNREVSSIKDIRLELVMLPEELTQMDLMDLPEATHDDLL